MGLWKKIQEAHTPKQPPAKRISTPAGQRLSVVLAGDAQKQKRSSFRKSAIGVTIEVPEETSEDRSQKSSGYSYSVWSDGEKFAVFRNSKQVTKRVGWKKILLALAIIIAAIIALAVGLAVGLKKKGSNDDSTSQSQAPAGAKTTHVPELNTNEPNNNDPSTNEPTPTDALPSPSSTPSNFPVGSYSMITFLDTIQTNCTSNPATWSCHPDTIYNTDPIVAVAAFNWIITTTSEGKLVISSTDNPYSISFKNADLKLQAEGEPSEHYRFQVSHTKTVTSSQPILEDDEDAEVECEFAGTSLQAFLYTKRPRAYPNVDKGEEEGDAKFPAWPYAVRIEQSINGGPSTPSCHKTSNNKPLSEDFSTDDASGLCSCLYRNSKTPSPYE